MAFIVFLTSMGFAITLLFLSIFALIIINVFPSFYFDFFLAIPFFLFLSTLFCLLQRIYKRGRKAFKIEFIGSVVFHAGLIMMIAFFVVRYGTIFRATFFLPEDRVVHLSDDKFSTIKEQPHFFNSVPLLSIIQNWQKSTYENTWFPVKHEAGLSVTLEDDDSLVKKDIVVAVNETVTIEGYRFILHSGKMSPLFTLVNEDGRTEYNQYLNLLNRPDIDDVFSIDSKNLNVHTRFFSDLAYKDGKPLSLSPEYNNPAFEVKIFSKDNPFDLLASGVIKKGQAIVFNNMTFGLTDIKKVVVVHVVKDITYFGIGISWAFIIMGLLLRYIPLLIGKSEDFQISIEEEDLY